jgi:SAM-dependent methyltransferase
LTAASVHFHTLQGAQELMDFKHFDRRNYPTVPARAGYGEWAATYEDAVPNQLDIGVLESLRCVNWSATRECLDLACGTGRIAAWLKARGVTAIDGIDLTQEAYRLSTSRATFAVVGMHPFFFMTGMPTHFKDAAGNPKAIETHVHLVSDHVRAALEAGWSLAEMYEGVIDEDWLRAKPKWERLRNYPVNFGYVWVRSG